MPPGLGSRPTFSCSHTGSSSINCNLPAQVLDSLPRDQNAIAAQHAMKIAPAGRKLLRNQLGAAEARRPIRHERAIRRPGYGILGDSLARREKSIDIVNRFTGRGYGDGKDVERSDALEIRPKAAYFRFGLVDRKKVARSI